MADEIVKHEGGESRTQRWKRLEREGKWEQVVKEMTESVNRDGGQNAIESE